LTDADERQELFMALWCLKEAVVKAKGTGINAPPGLQGFSVGE
jgi:phosphopantetheinyl transferase